MGHGKVIARDFLWKHNMTNLVIQLPPSELKTKVAIDKNNNLKLKCGNDVTKMNEWLGKKDSNLPLRIQSPLSYR